MCALQSALSLGSRIGIASLGCDSLHSHGPGLLFTAATRLLGLGLALALAPAFGLVFALVFKRVLKLALVFTLALAVCGSEMFCPACL